MKEILILIVFLIGAALAADPIHISGKDFSDFNLTDNSDLGISNDLGGEVWSNSLTSDDNASTDGAPFGGRTPLLVGGMMGYNRTAQALNRTVG